MKKAPPIRGYGGAHTELVSCSLGNFIGDRSFFTPSDNGNKAGANLLLFLLSAKKWPYPMVIFIKY